MFWYAVQNHVHVFEETQNPNIYIFSSKRNTKFWTAFQNIHRCFIHASRKKMNTFKIFYQSHERGRPRCLRRRRSRRELVDRHEPSNKTRKTNIWIKKIKKCEHFLLELIQINEKRKCTFDLNRCLNLLNVIWKIQLEIAK